MFVSGGWHRSLLQSTGHELEATVYCSFAAHLPGEIGEKTGRQDDDVAMATPTKSAKGSGSIGPAIRSPAKPRFKPLRSPAKRKASKAKELLRSPAKRKASKAKELLAVVRSSAAQALQPKRTFDHRAHVYLSCQSEQLPKPDPSTCVPGYLKCGPRASMGLQLK